jgi:thiamine biosynthesis protein ThiI
MGTRGNNCKIREELFMKKFISLFSGGLDSPVAAYLIAKNGFEPIFLSFLTSDDSANSLKLKIINILKKLKTQIDHRIKVYFINHDSNLSIFQQNCDRKLTCILCKRMMLRIAIAIGKREGTNLVVTGDILGEQASQTLDNLIEYNDLMRNFIIIRPLIGWDKLEVINLNKKLGLYNITSLKSASCQFNPIYPETHAKKHEIIKSELLFNISEIVENSLKRAEILEF